MRLANVYIRFYKSFNFDYLRKYNASTDRYPWEKIDESWYPYVRIPIEEKVTTIVGANESGKSHLLSAIDKGLTGKGIERDDFCRYSRFFTVAKGERLWPEFGFEWTDVSESEADVVRKACGLSATTAISGFFLFRTARTQLTVYLRNNSEFSSFEVKPEQAESLSRALPQTFFLDSHLALPSSVSIRSLSALAAKDADAFANMPRKRRFEFLANIGPTLKNASWFQTGETVKVNASEISARMNAAISATQHVGSPSDDDREVELVKDLVFKVAQIDEDAFDDLYRAMKEGKDGHAIGLVDKINAQLATRLNFPKWWVQDKEFSLKIGARDHDLFLTIQDRTGTSYSFNERSSGLKYFLSYYVQYLAHEPKSSLPEILLMDEPDAYLSSQAQQDLLKIFEAFANPEDGSRPIQVIYVTHSPFLIDKNHADRIRVLEKGSNDEGTRVVKDASKNHYEPLRSAFGAFVAETTFIGNCNLMVEGVADQVLLAGVATQLRSKGAAQLETLDLNRITIVPAGSASHVPYLVYLARGRDVEQPAVIVLLDSDKSGNDARKRLKRGAAHGKQILADKFVMQIADLSGRPDVESTFPEKLIEIEDLIPIEICTKASARYAKEICYAPTSDVDRLTPEFLRSHISESSSTFEGIEKAFKALSPDGVFHIEKLGFARLVTEVTRELPDGSPARSQLERNFRSLFKELNRMTRDALRELNEEKVSHKLKRHRKAFLEDHPTQATKEEAYILLETLEASLDSSSPETDAARVQIQKLRREHNLEENMTKLVDDFAAFREGLETVAYAGRLATQEVEPTAQQPPKDTIRGATSTANSPELPRELTEENRDIPAPAPAVDTPTRATPS